jgi:hypothetical protein
MQPSNNADTTAMENTQSNKLNMDRGTIIRSLVPSLIINGALPFLIYSLLKNYTHVSDLVALLATGVPSVIDSIVGIIRNRRLDFLAGFTLFTIVVSLILIAFGGSPKLYLIRESFFTAAFGIAYLVSLPFPKPLAFYFARYFMAGNHPERIDYVNQLWERSPYFRMALRRIGLIWSVGLLLEAAVRTYMVLTLSVQQFLAISPFVLYGITGALIVLTVYLSRRMRRQGEEARRRNEATSIAQQ